MYSNVVHLLILILGYLIGTLTQRWIYFNKTGKHLQDVEKNNDEDDV
jgi:hypothetical protein